MEDLNKNQLILLALLVSFVSSIATSILTVSLLGNQEGPTVTQTINRVVERTIEKVVPEPIKLPSVLTESEQIGKVIADSSPSVLKIVVVKDGVSTPTASGFVVSDRLVATILPETSFGEGISYQIKTSSADPVGVELVTRSASSSVAILRVPEGTTLSAPLNINEVAPSIGQSAVTLGSLEGENGGVAVGVISAILKSGDLTFLKTNTANADNLGGPVMNLKGEVVGASRGAGQATSAAGLKALLDTIK